MKDDDDDEISLYLPLSMQQNEGDVGESMRIKLVGLCVCEQESRIVVVFMLGLRMVVGFCVCVKAVVCGRGSR